MFIAVTQRQAFKCWHIAELPNRKTYWRSPMKVNLVNYGVKLKKRVLEGVISIIFVEYTRGLSFVLL